MKLRIGSLFAEPGYSFNASFRIRKLIEKLLNQSIMNNIVLGDSKTFLSFHITTGKNITNAEAKGPDINKKINCITWALWLPHNKIVNADDYELAYCHYFFEAAMQVFDFYNIENADREIQKIIKEVKQEIISDPLYRIRDEETEV